MPQHASRVYQDLVSEILSGVYPAGSRLGEEKLAVRLGVSRTPVREALQRLHADGLVELAPNRGAQVAQWSDAEIGDIFELRILLEGYAVRRAAERGIDESAGLLELCDAMEQRLHKLDRRSYDEITEINMRFHRALYRSAGSRMLSALLSGVIQVPLVRHTFHHYTPHELNRSFSQHRDLIEAINARDGAWAEAIMHSHILAGQAALERSANEQVKPTDRTPSGGEEPS